MPRIPGVPVPQTGTRALPVPGAPRISAEGLSAPGDQLMRVGRQLGALAEEERRRADETRILEVDGRADDLARQLAFDPEQGALVKRGQDAFGLSETVVAAFDASAATWLQALTPEQRRVAEARVAQARTRLATTVNRHEADERGRYALSVATNRVASATETAWAQPADVAVLAESEQAIRVAAESAARLRGVAPEEATREAVSRLYAGAVERLLAGDPGTAQIEAARQVAGAAGAKLAGPDAARVTQLLASAGRTEEAQALYARAVAAHPGDRRAQVAFIRETASGEVEDKAISYADSDDTRRRQERAEAEARQREAVDLRLQRIGDRAQRGIPPSPDDVRFLESRGKLAAVQALVTSAVNGTARETNLSVWSRLTDLVGRNALTRGEVEIYRGQLSEADYRSFIEATAPRSRDPNAAPISSVLPGPQEQTLRAFKALGLGTSATRSEMDDDELARYYEFGSLIDRRQRALADKLGRRPTDEEFQTQVLQPIQRQVLTDDGGLFGRSRTVMAPFVAADDDGDFRVPLARIPAPLQAEYRATIAELAALAGRPVPRITDAVLERFGAALARNRVRPGLAPTDAASLLADLIR